MRSFNDWYFDLFESGNGARLNQQEIAEEAWDYQQSKVDELEHKAKLRESDHKALLLKYQATKKCWEDISKEMEELQKRLDAAFRVLSQLNTLDDEAHKRWKREACMFSQGESNAYEHSVRLLEQALKGGEDSKPSDKNKPA